LLKFVDEPGHHSGEVKKKIDDLNQLKSALNKMVRQCKGSRYSIEDRPIIDALYVE
jgi:MerR family transcriptional regulator, mercuric resistance operon regulatory protein